MKEFEIATAPISGPGNVIAPDLHLLDHCLGVFIRNVPSEYVAQVGAAGSVSLPLQCHDIRPFIQVRYW